MSDFDQHFSSLSDTISDVTAGSCDSATLKREAKVWRGSLDRYRRSVEKRSAEYPTSSLDASKPCQALSFLNPLVEGPLAQDATDSATAANHWESLALD